MPDSRAGKALLGAVALALVLAVLYSWMAGWLELAIVALVAFALGRLSARAPQFKLARKKSAARAEPVKTTRPARADSDVDAELAEILGAPAQEPAIDLADADEIAERIEQRVKARQRAYDAGAALAARREKLARRQRS